MYCHQIYAISLLSTDVCARIVRFGLEGLPQFSGLHLLRIITQRPQIDEYPVPDYSTQVYPSVPLG